MRLFRFLVLVGTVAVVVAAVTPAVASAEPRVVFEHVSGTAIKFSTEGCIDSGFVIGALDRNIIEGAPPTEEPYVVLQFIRYDTCIGDYAYWMSPAAPADSGYGWIIPAAAFVVSPNKMEATLRTTIEVDVYDGVSIHRTVATIDITFRRLSHNDPLAIASGTVSTPDETFTIDSSFSSDISAVRARESKD